MIYNLVGTATSITAESKERRSYLVEGEEIASMRWYGTCLKGSKERISLVERE
jgi:hypothetical protein